MAEWHNHSGGHVPENAVHGGDDVNDEDLYVGRVWENGDLIPGKIVPSHGVCYVAYGGNELAHQSYEVLVHHGKWKWKDAEDGKVPKRAIQGGHTSSGEPLYIGRSKYSGSKVIGKVHPSHKVLYVPFGGKEVSIDEYEVLCEKKPK
ncbi:natterin-4-like [Oppia nitens]|uniref:natterin-4-like n=1 Tax=Oppia nitens TaxID=1686743 RepID=UPI0023DC1F31|nr:natterin-4-like [Oppia nitens]